MVGELVFWRFQADPTRVGESLGYAAPAFDDRRWREVRAPVDFETCHPALDGYEGRGWFRHWVDVPVAWAGKRVVLRLEGVGLQATVWVNGHQVGQCPDPYLPCEFEVQDYLRPGEPGLVAVCVDNTRRVGEVPGRQWGWRNFGGLLREVTLRATDRCHLRDLRCAATAEDGQARLVLNVGVRNDRLAAVDVVVTASVESADGTPLLVLEGAHADVEANETVPLTLTSPVPEATLWSPDEPSLYGVSVTLLVDGEVVSQREIRTGFRTIEAVDGRLWLNGDRIQLTGFNRHEDSSQRHMCPDLELARRDFAAMKQAGANFVRLCHYPHHPGELALCDELGLLVMEEIPLYWWQGVADGAQAARDTLARARRQLAALIDRDRHHPAVVLWSVSNETDEARPEVVEGNAELVQLARNLDSTRLVVHVSDHWQHVLSFDAEAEVAFGDETRIFEYDDVICVNGYPSAAALTYATSSGTLESYDPAAATRFWRLRLAGLHARYPDKPILVTEFGSVSFHSVFDGVFSEDLHADIITQEFAGMDAPYVCGAAVWCWADHAWPPGTFDFCYRLSVSPYGVLTRDRRGKAALDAARDCFFERRQIEPPPHRASVPGPTGPAILMVRPHMRSIPEYALPDGYKIRTLRPDEGGLWTDIWREADPWTTVDDDLFMREFGDDLPALAWRSFIVEDEQRVGVAAITAWYNRTYKGEDYGQIHWVATRQSYWGRGIGKAMLSHALQQMARWHDKAFLATQTKRIPAIKLYLNFGFVPDLDYEGAREAWREVTAALDHPVLERLDL